MRSQIRNAGSFGAVLHDMPHNPLSHAVSPGLTCSANAPKDATFAHASGPKPRINRGLDPIRNRHCPDVAGLADHINDGPVVLPTLKMRNVQFCRFFPAQPASQEDPEQRPISLAFEGAGVGDPQERPCLVGGEPVAQTNTEVFRPFDSPDASSEIRAEQAGISGLVRKPADGREPTVNRARCKLT
jgi:hypothetical protein